jgi:cell fate (sporulation/competence/biofilm development) regulator YlbF (YheA/YmcA/DUF963 family)
MGHHRIQAQSGAGAHAVQNLTDFGKLAVSAKRFGVRARQRRYSPFIQECIYDSYGLPCKDKPLEAFCLTRQRHFRIYSLAHCARGWHIIGQGLTGAINQYTIMQTIIETEDAVQSKTRELCEAILQQPHFQGIRQRVESFMADAQAQRQYEMLSETGERLHHKQHQGETLTTAEIAAFDRQRDSFLSNPVAKGFMDAQEEMQQIKKQITKQITKTLELGRVPSEEDLSEGGGCGSGCGCHH